MLKKENYSVPIDLKDRIDAFLKSKSINIKGDSINDIKFVKAELE